MEGFRDHGFDVLGGVTKRQRSNKSRRPRPDVQHFLEGEDVSPSSSTPPSDNFSKASSDENGVAYNLNSHRKEMNLNVSFSRVSSCQIDDNGHIAYKSRKYDSGNSRGGTRAIQKKGQDMLDLRPCSEGMLALANSKSLSNSKYYLVSQLRNMDSCNSNGKPDGRDSSSQDNKLRKVKLKVGGVTRTIHAKSEPDSAGASEKGFHSDAPHRRQKPISQGNSDGVQPPTDQAKGRLQGVSRKNFSGGVSNATSKHSGSKMSERSSDIKPSNRSRSLPTSEAVRKSKRVPKRRIFDGESDDAEDEEIQYLERLKTAKISADIGGKYEDAGVMDGNKQKNSQNSKRRRSSIEDVDDDEESGVSRLSKKKLRSERESNDAEYSEEEEEGLDIWSDANKKKQKKESPDSLGDRKKEIFLTSRQRALQLGKDGSAGITAGSVEFPDGLPPPPPRKQKEKLSEVEQQLKKTEAAQRRRLQVEKADRESQAEAIRKILGQDSSRKKREDKLRKQRDELAKERAANATTLSANTIRWVMGPTGTVVTFAKDLGLPSIFDSKTCRMRNEGGMAIFHGASNVSSCAYMCKFVHAVIVLRAAIMYSSLLADWFCYLIFPPDSVTPLPGKNVLDHHAPMRTSTVIPNQSFRYAAFSATKHGFPSMSIEHAVKPTRLTGYFCWVVGTFLHVRDDGRIRVFKFWLGTLYHLLEAKRFLGSLQNTIAGFFANAREEHLFCAIDKVLLGHTSVSTISRRGSHASMVTEHSDSGQNFDSFAWARILIALRVDSVHAAAFFSPRILVGINITRTKDLLYYPPIHVHSFPALSTLRSYSRPKSLSSKYLNILQHVANRKIRAVQIELDDLFNNTRRYLRIFADAIDELMPEPTEAFPVDEDHEILMTQPSEVRTENADGSDPLQKMPPEIKRFLYVERLKSLRISTFLFCILEEPFLLEHSAVCLPFSFFRAYKESEIMPLVPCNDLYDFSPSARPRAPSHFPRSLPPSLFPFSLRLPHFTACARPPSPTPAPISPCVSSSFPFSRPICRSRSPFPARADLPSHPIFFSGVFSSPFPFPVARSSPSSVSPSHIVDGSIDSVSSSLSGVDDNRFLVLPLRRNMYLFLPPPLCFASYA
ncbi:hypothetical protein ACLOJK_026482 [Asimina triloba]